MTSPEQSRYRCCACDARIDYAEPCTIAGSLWFQAWCRFFFCAACWGLGSARYFPGARVLFDKLVASGAYPPDELPPDLVVFLGDIQR